MPYSKIISDLEWRLRDAIAPVYALLLTVDEKAELVALLQALAEEYDVEFDREVRAR
jgi:hypothetical protein